MQFSKDIAIVGRYFRRHRNQYMENFGLKSLHARFLIDICESPGISQDKLTQRVSIDKSNVARQAAFLEEKGFIIRKPSGEDKRVLCLYPSDKTRELLPGLQAAMQDWENAVLGDLTKEERTQLLHLMNRVRTWVERED